jgi:hypothetical protein
VRQVKEPYSQDYQRRHAPARPLFGFVPRAYYQWPGKITEQQFQRVPRYMRSPECPLCEDVVHYKVGLLVFVACWMWCLSSGLNSTLVMQA